ncbi:protein kinase domain-containing protein [Vogesella urethralis]|uniref:protein kinase domain-containing protein n=1 Tax=Vogesella urethralis TaxID=2592656 RepID=UPI001186FCAD|nr:response regulator [Vogesella urethralis]
MISLPAYTSGSLLYDSGRTLVYRSHRQADGLPVILKVLRPTARDSDEVSRFQAEYACLQRLSHAGIVQAHALLQHQQHWVMVLEDCGGEALSHVVQRCPPGAGLTPTLALEMALQLCDALHAVHQAGLVHRDVNPANIVWQATRHQLQLIDFGLACPPRSDTQPGVLHEGTLAYSSPEHTGRTSHGLDHRADYYSMGVTLYQLLCGQLPFDNQDSMELIHAHLARVPDYQHPALAALPPQLLAIVQRLLEKHPDRRYQSMAQIKCDLLLCQPLLDEGQTGPALPAQHGTRRGHLQLSEQLYGRDTALAQLQQSLQRCRQPHSELCLIGGHAGIGKTALAEALRLPATQAGSFFIAGKCEQYRRHMPYAAVLQALRQLLQQLLTLPRAQVAQWATLLHQQLGTGCNTLARVLPELALLLPDTAASALAPGSDSAALPPLLASLVAVFASPHHPLVILLDDLQWADQATLDLLALLLVQHPHILLLGTYRELDNGEEPPLAKLLAQLDRQEAATSILLPAPLDHAQIAHWLADSLQVPADTLGELAALCLHKTGGNPFFLRQFVRSLQDGGLLHFHPDKQCWFWQTDAVAATPVTDNVLTWMVDKVHQLPPAHQQLLQLAATLGNRFALDRLAALAGLTRHSARQQLQSALQAELLQVENRQGDDEYYHFPHDRIQQAAYVLLDEAGRQRQHLNVGRKLLAELEAGRSDTDLYGILAQLNAALPLLRAPEERAQLAALNAQAGQQALQTAAYPAALHHLQLARQLLPADSPPAAQHRILLALCQAASHCQQWALADALYPQLEALAANPDACIAGYRIQMQQYLLQARYQEALALQCRGLAQLGIPLPQDDDAQQCMLQDLYRQLGTADGGPDSQQLAALPLMQNPQARDALALLFGVSHAAYLCGQHALDTLAILHMTRLSLQHGHGESSPFAYVLYASLLAREFDHADAAERIGQFAMQLAQQQPAIDIRGNTAFLYASVLGHWQHPLRQLDAYYEQALQDSRDSGDRLNIGYLLAVRGSDRLLQGQYLPTLLELAEQDLQQLQSLHLQAMYDCACVGSIQPICCLMGLTYHPHSFDDESFSEQDFLQRYHDRPMQLAYYYHGKLMTACLLQAPDALALSTQLPLIATRLAGQFKVSEAGFYRAIILARALRASPDDPQASTWRQQLQAQLAQHARWQARCPENFAARHALLQAELARCDGEALAAQQAYQKAINLANHHGFQHLSALASECYGDYWLACGQHSIARLFLQQAWQGYQAWGAAGKCRQMQQHYQLRGLTLLPPPAGKPGGVSDTAAPASHQGALDLASILKATRALSGELGLERVLARLLEIVSENTGAQHARLLLQYQDHWLLERGEGKPEPVLLDARQHPQLPLTLVRYVIRTGEALLEGDLARSQRFNHDPYVEQHQPSSVLCLPILRKQQVIGVLYLENRLISHAFSHERLTFLRMLVLQALVSIDNARLYDNLERQVQERTKRLDRIRLEQQAILDNALVGIAFVRDRIIQHCNQGFCQMLGYGEDELTLQSTRCLYQHESDYQLVGHQTRHSPLATDMALQRKDGSTVWCAIHAKLVNPDDPDAGMVVVIMDISARKAAEHDMQESRQRAEEATRTKSLFLANMSHEIRTPMNAILGMARLALQRAPDLQVSHYLHKILSSGEGLLQILNDILDFSKIEAGKLALESVPFALDDVLERVADVLVLRTQDKPVEPVFRVAADVPQRLIGDPLRLEQILCNLASNAAKFTERGQITLSVSASRRDPFNVTLRFALQDSGIGIEPALREHLFHSFTQADGSVTRRYGGTGLGLAICKQLASLMQAELQVDSQPGQGSCFSLLLTLPWQAEAVRKPALRPLQVLVADDHPHTRSALCDMLHQFGMHASEASDGVSTLGMLYQAQEQGDAIDLLLLDSDMPGWSAPETLQRIRDARLLRQPVVVMMNHGYHHADSEHVSGVEGALNKPVRPAALQAQLQLLAGHRQPPRQDSQAQLQQQLASLSGVAGNRILLVDDNAINREVVLGLLENSGLLIDVAENGIDAVDAVNCSHYDLVLMDIQMPLLDGFAATRQIRANPAHAGLPIVALSAHAMVSDHQASQAAGMNDHLDKPIVPAALVAALLRWLPVRQTSQPRRVFLPGRQYDLAQRLRQHFVASYRPLPAKLQLLHETGDWASIEYHTHSLKAAAAYVDAPRLSALASSIEKALRDHQRLAAEALLPEMQDELENTLQRLQTSMPPPEALPAQPRPLPEQLRLLQQLQDKLKHADSRADEALQALFEAMPQECHEQLGNIGKLLDQIEYDQAYRQLQSLIKKLDSPIGSTT